MVKIACSRKLFDEISQWSLDVLDSEISKNAIRARLTASNFSIQDKQLKDTQANTLNLLKAVSQLRRGKISRAEFDQKIFLF
ncbi:hypothetical protein [Pedobacter aquatilis]|uniref:hypothetical protein n=1 Tax=Pedobacter aquatilis TaxID=351343 RepID=UPI00292FB151|nr:hypothetical protein [Pedobacter aquatilis]